MAEKERSGEIPEKNGPGYVEWFREASPYIHRFRGETFLLLLDGGLLREGRMGALAHDIALLSSLGIRLVIVFGAGPQIDASLESRAVETARVGRRRITPPEALVPLMESVGRIRFEIEASLSQGTDGTPMAGSRIRVVSGNFVIGRPLGVIDGIDFLYTGTVRRIESEAIRHHLDQGDVVLLSPLAFSPTGEIFNVLAFEVASRAAVAVDAAKLILLGLAPEIRNERGEALRQLVLPDARARESQSSLPFSVLYEALEQGVPASTCLTEGGTEPFCWNSSRGTGSERLYRGIRSNISVRPFSTIWSIFLGSFVPSSREVFSFEGPGSVSKWSSHTSL